MANFIKPDITKLFLIMVNVHTDVFSEVGASLIAVIQIVQ